MYNAFIDYIDKHFNAIFPVVTPIIIFIIGLCVNWRSNKINKKRKLESTKKIVEKWSKSIEPTFTHQIEECNNFINSIKGIDRIQELYLPCYELLIDRINNIDFKEFGETFVLNLEDKKKENVNLLFELITYLNFLSNFSPKLNKINGDFNESASGLMKDWNDSFRNFINVELKYTLY